MRQMGRGHVVGTSWHGGHAHLSQLSILGPFFLYGVCFSLVVGPAGERHDISSWLVGVRGFFDSFIDRAESSLLPFLWLHGWHEATRFSHVEDPPLERGTTWSMVVAGAPQY